MTDHVDAQPNHPVPPPPAATIITTTTKPNSGLLGLIVILALILGSVGAFLLWKKYHAAPATAPAMTATDIRDTFTPPANFKPTFAPPMPSPAGNLTEPENNDQGATAAQNNTSDQAPNPLTSDASQNSPPDQQKLNPLTTNPPASNPPASSQTYSSFPNSPIATTQKPQVAGAQTRASRPAPPGQSQEVYQPYIETYPANGVTLNDLQNILQSSPSVTSVTATIYQGQPALKYTAQTLADGGIAYIANNTIYYVHGL